MFIFLDVLVVSIIVLCAILSAKKGFVYVAVEVAGFVAAILLAISLSGPLAEVTYENVIEDAVVEAAENSANDGSESAVDTIWNSVPGFVRSSAEKIGITKSTLSDELSKNAEMTAADAARTASQNLLKPVVTKLLGMLYSTIIFIILIIVVKILARVVNKLFSFSIIGKLNTILGALIGVVKGIIIATAFCMILTTVVSFAGGKFLIFTAESIADSKIFDLIASISPFNR